jgi:hypothetical protein
LIKEWLIKDRLLCCSKHKESGNLRGCCRKGRRQRAWSCALLWRFGALVAQREATTCSLSQGGSCATPTRKDDAKAQRGPGSWRSRGAVLAAAVAERLRARCLLCLTSSLS